MVHLNLFINEEDTEADKNCFQLISFGLRVSQWTKKLDEYFRKGSENLIFDGHQGWNKPRLKLLHIPIMISLRDGHHDINTNDGLSAHPRFSIRSQNFHDKENRAVF